MLTETGWSDVGKLKMTHFTQILERREEEGVNQKG